jgi:putrescine transport system ATP-binding protein
VFQSTVGRFTVADKTMTLGETAWLALRPEKIRLGTERPADAANAIAGTVFETGYRGDRSVHKVRLADRSLMKVAVPNTAARRERSFSPGDVVWLSWPADAGVVLTQ